MGSGSTIVSVTARQVFSERGHPGIEATVTTQNGASGVAMVTAGISVGEHEVQFAYDGGKRWGGRGVQKAVNSVTQNIAPALLGMDATKQLKIDSAIIALDDTPMKSKLGGNATASVSAAALQAGAASLGIPLYQHIGGANACVMPVPGVLSVLGSSRYGGGGRSGGKPSYSFICYGFGSFSEAAEAAWDVSREFAQIAHRRFGAENTGRFHRGALIPSGLVKHDRELWDLKVEAIAKAGYEGRIGFQVDVAAGTYYEKTKDRFVGLFSAQDKTRDDLIELYGEMERDYPFVILEDPLDEDDYEGHAILTQEFSIEIVGDDLFTTNPERVKHGIETGAANAVLLKVNQIGTISEAFEMVRLAYRNGYGVMPCDSRGEGPLIADYAVGLNTGHLREGGTGPVGNRFLQIEAELGSRAEFLGLKGLQVKR
ncbi:MAG: enolase C-terminal domain-like protein [Anaerolineae bacterium]